VAEFAYRLNKLQLRASQKIKCICK